MLMSVMVFALCFQVPMWLPCSQIGAQPLWFLAPQLFGIYPWQAYVPPWDDLWLMPGVGQGATPSTALSMRSFMLLIQLSPSHSIHIVGHKTLGLAVSH